MYTIKKMKQSKMKSTKIKKTVEKEDVPIVIDDDGAIKPNDQLILSPDELDEQYGNILNIKEPSKLQDRVIYSIKNKKFVPKVDRTTFITLIDLKSSLLELYSAEARIQTANESCRVLEVAEIKRNESIAEAVEEEEMYFENNAIYKNTMPSEEVGEEFRFDEGEMIEEMSTIGEDDFLSTVRGKDAAELEKESHVSKQESEHTIVSLPVKRYCAVVKLKNKFSFFDRCTETKNIDTRNMITQTMMTKRTQIHKFVSLSDIFKAYSEDWAILEAEREKEIEKKKVAHVFKRKNADIIKNSENVQETNNALIVGKTIEKIVSFNASKAIAQDFRYYEDQSDKFRDKGKGTLMMMWSMVYKKKRTLIVTDISWSPDYFDLFGITLCTPLGSIMDPANSPDTGYVCLWSLKNASYPHVVNRTHAGAICLSFHPNHGHVYVVGLRDGNLAVYNTSLLTGNPQYKTNLHDAKHSGCVRQVVWREDLPSGELNFYSVSDDGTVCQWILIQDKMVKIIKLSLTIDMYPESKSGGLKLTYNAIGTTIAFNPEDPECFLIGTTEGYIFKCNTEWCSYVQRFRAHTMKVNRIDYNKFNPNIYVTCSDDFTVKLWDGSSEAPLILINLKTSLTDVRWSPFSSTVFCVIAENCRAIFYDLAINMKTPVCDQLILSPNRNYRPVRLAFDRRVPLIVIGSFKGTVITFKLSPNLRTIMKSPRRGIQIPTETLEYEKLQAVLHGVRKKIN